MSLHDALHRGVRNYPGGVDAVAHRLGKAPSTFARELRDAEGFKLGAADALSASVMCADLGREGAMDYANAVADAHGAMLVLLPRGEVSDSVTAKDVATFMRECADVVSATADADSDGHLSDREIAEVGEHVSHVVAAMQQLMRNLQARATAQKERHRAAVEGAR